jgi:hypothetical protein
MGPVQSTSLEAAPLHRTTLRRRGPAVWRPFSASLSLCIVAGAVTWRRSSASLSLCIVAGAGHSI